MIHTMSTAFRHFACRSLLPCAFLIILGVTTPSHAMMCIKDGGGSNWEAENIGVLAIPADLPLGTVLWTSSTRTRSVTCDPELNPYGEFVHFYGNPQNQSIMKGVGMGIIYNGRDLGVVSPGHKIATNVWVDSGHPKRATYKFQVYLKKIGNISGRSADEIAVFQLDGEQGLNGGEGSNYRYILTGLNNIKVTHCSVSIVAPAELDFGSISPLNTGVAASRDFSVTATKNSACTANDKLGVKLVFSPVSGDLFDNDTTLGLGGEVYFGLSEGGRKVKFNNPISFWDNIQSGSQNTVVFKGDISVKDKFKLGRVSKSIVLNVNYI
ncbi:MAG: hypothetical protein E7F77_13330 [Serratia marcescens]|nr:hypothetical protein [Serratia marcescens]MBN5293589.1 hypothetical protein [Serratia marcescens]MDU3571800.1 hypothetical protein [Serratia marcescens]MDU3646593.1 hypothetical protein [Serratia marcescens]HEJ7271633.1 hypothetical protein [Serratia marcescens]